MLGSGDGVRPVRPGLSRSPSYDAYRWLNKSARAGKQSSDFLDETYILDLIFLKPIRLRRNFFGYLVFNDVAFADIEQLMTRLELKPP